MAEPESVPSSADAPETATWAGPSLFPGPGTERTIVHTPPDVAPVVGPPTETAVPAADETDVESTPNLPQIPGYRLIRAVGSGGMGTVFKAVQLELDRVVALKLINAGWTAEEFRVRFDREAKTLAALDHPNIVPVFDAGSWQGLPFLTMKFVTGKTLYHRLEVMSRDLRAAVPMLVQVARAVQYLHSQGIIHRDLKPLNILLTADGTPLVADFGLVRPIADDSDLSLSLVPLGTRQYMSPEQTRGGRENYTPACDIWALGIILYELLAGCRPFGHDDPVELFRMIRNEPVPPIPADRNAPAGLETIARKCLAKRPADRYATAEDVAADLERWLAGNPIADPVPPAPPAEETPTVVQPAEPVKKPRRLPVLFATGAGVLVAVLAAWGFGAFHNPSEANPTPPDDPPAPLKRSALERFAAGESIELTDAKGNPTGDVIPFKGHEVTWRPKENGHHEFSSHGTGVVELSSDDYPRPFRVEADVALTQRRADPNALIAVYAGRKLWEGGEKPHRSLFWFGIMNGHALPALETQLVGEQGMYWWEGDQSAGHLRFDSKQAPLDPGAPFVRVTIDVSDDAITSRIGKFDLEPRKAGDMLGRLKMRNGERTKPLEYTFAQPVFGPGIGVYLSNADGIVANLTVSKPKQKP